MRAERNLKDKWIILTLCVWLATLTNHSRGDVVYRKVATLPSPPNESMGEAPEPEAIDLEKGLKILKVTRSATGLLALIGGGSAHGLVLGNVLEGRRLRDTHPDYQEAWIPTGQLKLTEVREDYALAHVHTDGSPLSSLHFPDYPGVMVGDRVFLEVQNLTQTIRVVPTRVLTYDQLFTDPKGFPTTFELTPEGKSHLIEQASVFVNLHTPLLLIEGHTDHHGDRQSNQIESYQRALTIRQTLIDELGLDPDRLVAIGLGETEMLPEPYLPGRDRQARRIVLKAKNHQSTP